MHKGYYTTLEERLVGKVIPFWAYDLKTIHSDILNEFFKNTEINLTIPATTGSTIYELRVASLAGKLFMEPYNPIVVYKNSKLVGIIHSDYYIAREEDSFSELEPYFIKMENPKTFFKECSERWGKCSICGRKITQESSLERAMGPVCFNRVSNLSEWFKSYKTRDFRYEVDEGNINSELNPIEQGALTELNEMIKKLAPYGIKDDYALYEFKFVPITSIAVYKNKNSFRGATDDDTAKIKSIINFIKVKGLTYGKSLSGYNYYGPAIATLNKFKAMGISIQYVEETSKVSMKQYNEEEINGPERLSPRKVENEKEEAPSVPERRSSPKKEEEEKEVPVRRSSPKKAPKETKSISIKEEDGSLYVYNWPWVNRKAIKLGSEVKWDPINKRWILPIKYKNELEILVSSL